MNNINILQKISPLEFFRDGHPTLYGSGITRAVELDPTIEFINDVEMEQFKCIIKRDEKKLGEKLGENLPKLTNNRKIILESIARNSSTTIAELSQMVGISTTAIENNIKYLKENNLLKRVGSFQGNLAKGDRFSGFEELAKDLKESRFEALDVGRII